MQCEVAIDRMSVLSFVCLFLFVCLFVCLFAFVVQASAWLLSMM